MSQHNIDEYSEDDQDMATETLRSAQNMRILTNQ